MSVPVKVSDGKRIPLSDLSNNSPVAVRKSPRLIDTLSIENSDLNSLSNVKASIDASRESMRAKKSSDTMMTPYEDNVANKGSISTDDDTKTPPTKELADECSPPKKSIKAPRNIKKVMSLATHIRKYGSTHDIDS